MTAIRRLALSIDEVRNLREHRLRHLVRPIGAEVARFRAGDRVWVREPFHLPARFDDLAPSQAERFGCGGVQAFAADSDAVPDGVRRAARVLLRGWHRAHLVIVTAGELRLHAVDWEQLGFASLDRFRAHWDEFVEPAWSSFGGQPGMLSWSADPRVILLEVGWVEHPLPELLSARDRAERGIAA